MMKLLGLSGFPVAQVAPTSEKEEERGEREVHRGQLAARTELAGWMFGKAVAMWN
jgi:hypothetical protein